MQSLQMTDIAQLGQGGSNLDCAPQIELPRFPFTHAGQEVDPLTFDGDRIYILRGGPAAGGYTH